MISTALSRSENLSQNQHLPDTVFFTLCTNNENSSFVSMFSCCIMYRSMEMDELSIDQVLAFLTANDLPKSGFLIQNISPNS